MPKKPDLRPWEIVSEKEVFVADPWVRVAVETVRLPDGRVIDDYYQMKLIDCVVICAQTPEGKIVMERQYKHGVRKVTWTLPMGGVDKGEDALEAARRELLEETGYISDDWVCLGNMVLMANQKGGKANLFLARNVRKIADPVVSDLEEMEIHLLAPQDLIHEIQRGEISVLCSVSAIALATNPLYVASLDERSLRAEGEAIS